MDKQGSHAEEMSISELFELGKMFGEADASEDVSEDVSEPVNRPLAEEVMLACAEQFQGVDLRLYEASFEAGGGRRDGWLFGDGERLFSSVMPSEDGNMHYAGHILCYPEKDMAQGKLDPLVDRLKLRLLRLRGGMDGPRPNWVDELRPVPVELYEKMAQARLLKPKSGSGAWEPSHFGARYGIVPGFRLLDGRRTCRTFFAAEGPLNELKDLLAGSQCARESRKAIPMEERLARLDIGLPGNDAYAVDLVKRLGDMPLEQYMGQCLDKLEQLRKELPGGPVSTVGEAAAQISRACHTPGCSAEQCKNLIWLLLAVPMITDMQKFRKFERGA